MNYLDTFQRVEHKFLIHKDMREELMKRFEPYVEDDVYPEYSLYNIYCDSSDHQMIRQSIEGPMYKEKLRLRSYSDDVKHNPVFLEMKKKYDGIVYKRRIVMNYEDACAYLEDDKPLKQESQIGKEIDYMKQFYHATPQLYIGYDRRAFKGIKESDLRITFDENIRYRFQDLKLQDTAENHTLLKEDECLMEIKVMNRYPIWLANLLTEYKITKTSFSKYGAIYSHMVQEQQSKKHETVYQTESRGQQLCLQVF